MHMSHSIFADAYTDMLFGNYRIVRPLGRGGSAHVLLGQHRYLETRAAIKVLRQQREQDERQLRKEAHILAQMQHPHIIRLREFALQDAQPFLALDYAPYGNLRQYYAARQPLPLTSILRYVKQMANALQHIHDRGWLHLDVKPENMLVARHGYLWLSDFGIAQPARYASTTTGKVRWGTAAYMAPEQLHDIPCPASDQYALAIVVYEWLCGSLPFQGTALEIASQHIHAPQPSLRARVPQLSPAVEYVVQKALAKDPTRRFASVNEFAENLEQSIIKAVARQYVFSRRPGSSHDHTMTYSSYITEKSSVPLRAYRSQSHPPYAAQYRENPVTSRRWRA